MRLHRQMTKTVLQNLLLSCCSIILALGTGEVLLRAFFPKYQYAAESPYELDSLLTWKPTPNTRRLQNHPDTNEPHPVIYNNYGFRQHRDFTQEEIEQSVVISVIGDSFPENRGLPIQYGVTEILDYLLNSEDDPAHYLVLNFGVSGYGTDQAYIKYTSSPLAKHSAHVFYILCENDLGDIYNNNLFTIQNDGFYINETDKLVQLPANNTSRLKLFLQKFYLTYLVIDAISGFEAYSKPKTEPYIFDTNQFREERRKRKKSSLAKQINHKVWSNTFGNVPESKDTMEIMKAILNELRFEVEKNGGEFHIIVLPNVGAHNIATNIPEKHKIVDLYDIFTKNILDYDWKDMRFKNDGHWAELGNMYTAIALKQYIKNEDFNFSAHTKTYSLLDCYYQAFGNHWLCQRLFV